MTDIQKNPLQSVLIVGAGRMGVEIACWMVLKNRTVTIVETSSVIGAEAAARVREFLNRRVERHWLSVNDSDKMLNQLRIRFDYTDIGAVDLVIECVPEDLGIKRNVYAQMSTVITENTIVCSNTSSIEISRLAELVDAPGRFMGTHFFYPVLKNPVVELVRGKKTDPGLLRHVRDFFTEHGKKPIATKDSPAFLVNRFFVPYINTAHWLMEEMQLSAATIDEVALKLFGSRQGPIEVSSWIGLKHVLRDLDNMSRLGHFYTPTHGLRLHALNDERTPLGDTQAISEAQESRIQNTLMGCVFFVILQILDEGVGTAEDTDLAARLGLKFSILPCALMDSMGRDAVAEVIAPILELHGDGMPMALEDVGTLTSQ